MRISDRSRMEGVRANLARSLDKMERVNREVSTGRRIHYPSDDPAGAATALRYRSDLALGEQFSRTANASRARLEAADSALGGLTDVLQRARELTLRAGSPAAGAAELQTAAIEVNQLLKQAVQLGNTSFAGRFIFGGTITTTAPFNAAGEIPAAVTYGGNGGAIDQEIGQGTLVRTNVPGDQAFLPTMNALIQIRDALNSGDAAGALAGGLPALDSALDGLLRTRGDIGARVNHLESVEQKLGMEKVNLTTLKSNVEDVDIAESVVRLNEARNVWEAALGAAAKAIQPTLVDFLR
jgi:flagellar hook-associated protein 3 FlgL